MAWKPEVNEPLAVQVARHLFQNGDAPLVVLDQIIVGAEHRGDLALSGEGRIFDRNASDDARIEVR